MVETGPFIVQKKDKKDPLHGNSDDYDGDELDDIDFAMDLIFFFFC